MPYKKDGVAFDYVEAQNHRTVWVGRDLKVHAVPTLCHGQGPLPPARLPPAPSRLALGTSREEKGTLPRRGAGLLNQLQKTNMSCEEMACESTDIYSTSLLKSMKYGHCLSSGHKAGFDLWHFPVRSDALDSECAFLRHEWDSDETLGNDSLCQSSPLFCSLLHLDVVFKSTNHHHKTRKCRVRSHFTSYILFMTCYKTL